MKRLWQYSNSMNNPVQKAGVYLHIPFCSGKCFYCDFYSAPAARETLDAYADALCRHIRQTPGRPEADTVYFGGGTPSLLGVTHLGAILEAVRDAFSLSPDAQITLEANPGDLCLAAGQPDDPYTVLHALREAGFDRLSLGAQSACDAELAMLGRRHGFHAVETAAEAARRAGFADLSLDLMYALPDQTIDGWLASIRALIALAPQHISCYALKLEQGAPLCARATEIPDEDTQLAMYLAMVETLADAGYRQYEISNFARPGFASRHNLKYWTGAPYYGFGPSAHSFINGVRYAWADDTKAYICGKYQYKEYTKLTLRDRMEERLMLALRTVNGLDLAGFCEEFGQNALYFTKILDRYIPPGFVQRENLRYCLTPRGMFVSDYIIAELFGAIEERNA